MSVLPGPRPLRGGERRLQNDPRFQRRAGPAPSPPAAQGHSGMGSSRGQCPCDRSGSEAGVHVPAFRQAERAANACVQRPDRLRGRCGDRSHSPAEGRDTTQLEPLLGPGDAQHSLLGREGQAETWRRKRGSERHRVTCPLQGRCKEKARERPKAAAGLRANAPGEGDARAKRGAGGAARDARDGSDVADVANSFCRTS